MLGPEWHELYSIAPETEANRDLFDEPVEPEIRCVVSVRQFESWLKGRLEGEFKFVSQPLPILTTPSRQAFSLFLGVSNPSEAAIDLAKKFVRYVNKHFAPGASRRRSDAELPAGSLLVLSTPLFKKERGTIRARERFYLFDPLGIHGSRARATLAADNYPIDLFEICRRNRTNQWFK